MVYEGALQRLAQTKTGDDPRYGLRDVFPDDVTPHRYERQNWVEDSGTLRMYRGTTVDLADGDFVEEQAGDGYVDRPCSEIYFTVDAGLAAEFAAGKDNMSDPACTTHSTPVVVTAQVPLGRDDIALVPVEETRPDALAERNMTDETEYIFRHQLPAAWVERIDGVDAGAVRDGEERGTPDIEDVNGLRDGGATRSDILHTPFTPDADIEKQPLSYPQP